MTLWFLRIVDLLKCVLLARIHSTCIYIYIYMPSIVRNITSSHCVDSVTLMVDQNSLESCLEAHLRPLAIVF